MNSSFLEYLVPTSGKAFAIAALRFTLNNAGSSSTKTPQGLPALAGIVADFPILRAWTVYPDYNHETFKSVFNLWSLFVDRVVTLANTKGVQQLQLGRLDVPASVANFGGGFALPRDEVTKPSARQGEEPFITFSEKRGTTS